MRLLPILSILLACAAFAQDDEVPAISEDPNPVVEVVEFPPGVNPQPEEQQQPADQATLGDTLIVEAIEQPKLSGNDLAALYRKYTGHRVIVSSAASVAEFAFVQPASPQDPLTYRQAAELLKKAATIENFIFVPDGSNPNLEYLTLPTAGIKPTGIGVGVYNENDVLPEGDAVISYVMNLSYIKPDEAVRTFTQIIGQFGAFGSIAAVPNAASVVITENTSLIRKLIDLKQEIDKPSSQVATRFIDVTYADVTELAATLNELLGTQQNTSATAGVERAQPQAQPNIEGIQLPSEGSSASGEATPVQIIPDARTNRIFAMGRPVDLLFVEGLIREFDTQSDQRNFLRRKLKFLAVADFLPIAGDALTRAFSGTGTGDQNGQGGQQGGGNRQNQGAQQSNNDLFSGGGQQGGGAGGGGAGSSGTRGSALSAPQVNSAPESLLIGRTLLVADNITNSIVVQGPPSGVEIIENLLDQVDVKADQVMISTVFGQLNLGKGLSTGVDWIRAFSGNDDGGVAGSIIGGGPIPPLNTINPRSIIQPIVGSPPGVANRGGLSLYGRIGDSLASYINLLSTSGDFTVLSRPSIFTSNNQKGTISSGRKVPVPTSSFTGGGANGQSTNIEFRDVVLKLEVIPLINSESEITLQIALISDSIVPNQDVDVGGVANIPTIDTKEILTTVTVPNNQTIILGGLITTNDTENVTGIPILSDIPGLGRLFSTKSRGVSREELMIFIQPTIVNNDRSLDYVQTDMDERYNVSEPARNFADGSVLPPLEPIVEKGGPRVPRSVTVEVEVETESPALSRKSLRPVHRR